MDELQRDSAVTVTALNEYINMLMQADPILTNVKVRGELSNFKRHPSGHLYFSLKDEGGVLRCVMFRSAAAKMKLTPTDGMKLIARGYVQVYSGTGQYQLYVQALESDGIGDLYRAFEQLKAKLAKEGLFDEARKRPLPAYPAKIGIVTSPTGAAIQDMLNILGRRFPYAEVILYPALVQGSDAPADLIRGIRYFRANPPDLIIIGRGGGSIEDLWSFNDEGLAREIAACEVPVISAVGHETDFTICDFTADLRAPTPSAAAELAVPDTQDVLRGLSALLSRAAKTLAAKTAYARLRLTRLTESQVMRSPERALSPYLMQLAQLEERLGSAGRQALTARRHTLSLLAGKLQALSPLAVLDRGYAIPTTESGECIRSTDDVVKEQLLHFRLRDGVIVARAQEVTKEVLK